MFIFLLFLLIFPKRKMLGNFETNPVHRVLYSH